MKSKGDFGVYIEDLITKSDKILNDLIPSFDSNGTGTSEMENPHFQSDVIEFSNNVKFGILSSWINNNKQRFRDFLNVLFNASLYLEEGQQVRIRIALGKPDSTCNIEFKEPLDFNVKNIVKIAPTVNLWDRQLFVKPDSNGEIKIFGYKEGVYEGFASLNPNSFRPNFTSFEIHGPGEIRADFPFDYEYNKGDCRDYSSLEEVPCLVHWFKHIDSIICNNTQLGSRSIDFQDIANSFSNIIRYIREAKHGGCIAIVSKDCTSENIDMKGKAIESKYYFEKLVARNEFEKENFFFQNESLKRFPMSDAYLNKLSKRDLAHRVSDFHFKIRELEKAERFIASLSLMDGAVVLDRDFTIKSFGARFVAKSKVNSDDKPIGMRHKSAIDFCCSEIGSIAIVISQDGGITVYSHDSEKGFIENKLVLNYNRTDL